MTRIQKTLSKVYSPFLSILQYDMTEDRPYNGVHLQFGGASVHPVINND